MLLQNVISLCPPWLLLCLQIMFYWNFYIFSFFLDGHTSITCSKELLLALVVNSQQCYIRSQFCSDFKHSSVSCDDQFSVGLGSSTPYSLFLFIFKQISLEILSVHRFTFWNFSFISASFVSIFFRQLLTENK